MKTNKTAIQVVFVFAFGAVVTTTAHAASLVNGDRLTINAGVYSYDANYNITNVITGSWFAMDFDNNSKIVGVEKSPISQGTQGIVIGAVTSPGASHPGSPVAGDTNAIDAPWAIFGDTGSHYNNVAITGGTGGLNMTGWNITWNGIPSIPMGSGAWTLLNCATAGVVNCAFSSGVGNLTWDGIYGHGYSLDYAATVPRNDPSGFGDVHYLLHLEGTVQAVPVPAAVWLFGSGLAGLLGLTRRNRKQA